MAQVKLISPAGWDFDGPVARPIKVSSRGLIGNDRAEFLKYASHAFLPFLDEIKLAADEEPVHYLAVGADERWGKNRNGDGFSREACKRYHHTFEKFARAYRSHKNKDPKQSYGVIKKSAYNDAMDRIELLAAYNKTKEAAERNGGLVADKEMEKLARGESLAGSMACRVNFDSCSYCGHQARTRDEYCTPKMCKAGGCQDNLGKVVKVGNDVHHLGVMNPHPCFFDWSMVFRPAERTAYGDKADWLVKAAEENWDGMYGVSSSKAAEDLGVMAPLAVLLHQDSELPAQFHGDVGQQVKLAYGLDMLENRPQLHPPETLRRAFTKTVQGSTDLSLLGEPGTVKCADGLTALADQKIILPLRDFARLCNKAELTKSAQSLLPGVYGRMLGDGSLERCLNNNSFALSGKQAAWQQREWAARQGRTLSFEKQAIDYRCRLSALREPAPTVLKTGFDGTKIAGDQSAAAGLAQDYACYKLAALQRIASFDDQFALTCGLSIVQNQTL